MNIVELEIIELVKVFKQISVEEQKIMISEFESIDYSQFRKPEAVKRVFQAIIKYLYELQQKGA